MNRILVSIICGLLSAVFRIHSLFLEFDRDPEVDKVLNNGYLSGKDAAPDKYILQFFPRIQRNLDLACFRIEIWIRLFYHASGLIPVLIGSFLFASS